MENKDPKTFQDVKVFAGNNFVSAADVTYRNLVWENIGLSGVIKKNRKPWCTPGVCMEKANYPGDPAGYAKKHLGVRSREKCRMICNRDPVCCHWVHYGPNRGE